eukprot:Pgem_evm1s3080
MFTPLYNISQQPSHKGASILGPLLFLIFSNDLALQLEQTTNVPTIRLFADDLAGFGTFMSKKQAELAAQNMLDIIAAWMDKWRTKLSLPKTNYLLITGTHWGANPSTLVNTYKSLIRSNTDQSALPILMTSKTIQKKFEILQNDINRLATNNSRLNKVTIKTLYELTNTTGTIERSRHLIANYLTQANHNNHTAIQNTINTYKLKAKRFEGQ